MSSNPYVGRLKIVTLLTKKEYNPDSKREDLV